MTYFDDFEDGRVTGRTVPYQNLTVVSGTATIESTTPISGGHSLQHIGALDPHSPPIMYPPSLRLGNDETIEVTTRVTSVGTSAHSPYFTIVEFQRTDDLNYFKLETYSRLGNQFIRFNVRHNGVNGVPREIRLHTGIMPINTNYVFRVIRGGERNWIIYFRIEPSTVFEARLLLLDFNPGFLERLSFGAHSNSTVLYDNISIFIPPPINYFDDFEDNRITGRSSPYRNLFVVSGSARIISVGAIRGNFSIEHTMTPFDRLAGPVIYPADFRLGDNQSFEIMVQVSTMGTNSASPYFTIMGFQYNTPGNCVRLDTLFWGGNQMLALVRFRGSVRHVFREVILHPGRFQVNVNYVFRVVRSRRDNLKIYFRREPETEFKLAFEVTITNPGFQERVFFGNKCNSRTLYDNIRIGDLPPPILISAPSQKIEINMLTPIKRKRPRVHFIPGRERIISNVIGTDLTPPQTQKPDYETRIPKSCEGASPPKTIGQQGRFNYILWYIKGHRKIKYQHYTGHRFTSEQVIQNRRGNSCDLGRLVNRIATQIGLPPICGDPLPQVNYIQGRVFHKGRNYTHIWCEVMVDGSWRTIDMVHYLLSGTNSVFGEVMRIDWKRNALGINPC